MSMKVSLLFTVQTTPTMIKEATIQEATQEDKGAAAAAAADGVEDGGTAAAAAPSSSSTVSKTETETSTSSSANNTPMPADPSIVSLNGHAPNSKPRKPELDEDTYVYRDFSTLVAPPQQSMNPQSLQAQKLPAKLASMLSDPGKRIISRAVY